MERQFKHRKTGELAYYKDGVFKQGRFCVEIGVEPSSEVWEEVIERDYEILSFVSVQGDISFKRKNGLFLNSSQIENTGEYEENSHTYPYWKIHSVKRFSDGEVFTLGDKVIADFLSNGIQHISKFELEDGKLSVQLLKENNPHFVSYVKLDKLKRVEVIGKDFYDNDILKYSLLYIVSDTLDLYNTDLATKENIKGVRCFVSKELAEKYIEKNKPLFTTLDNVELKHGDKFYVVDAKFFKIFEAEAGVTFKTEKWIKNSYSDKKLAEEYILLNKPVLSLEDLLSVWSTDNLYYVYKESPMFQNFKKLAESKIKGDE